MVRKIYDTWMNVSLGNGMMILEATNVMNTLAAIAGRPDIGDIMIHKFEFVGCAARVQIECNEETIEVIKTITRRKWEETKPLP